MLAEVGRFVDVEPQAVTQPVAEPLAIAGGGDEVASDGIDLGARLTGPAGLDGGELRVEDDLIDLGDLGGKPAKTEGPCHVRAVPVGDGTPVDEKHPLPDRHRARLVVDHRAPGTRGHHRRKARPRGPPHLHLELDRRTEREFRHAGGKPSKGDPHGLALDRGRPFDRSDFLIVLADPQLRDKPLGGHECFSREDRRQRLLLCDRQVLRLDAEPADAAASGETLNRFLQAMAGTHNHVNVPQGGPGLQKLVVAGVGDDGCPLNSAHQQEAVIAHKSGQVADVGGV